MLETAERARVRIGAFVLDRSRGVLLDEAGAVVPLRPKAWAMLNFLVAHAGQVVEREALLDAVWPDVTVTDDSVTQCVAELRRVLGENGPKWLRTVPRRGYVFDVAVEAEAAASPGVGTALAEATTVLPATVHSAVPTLASAPRRAGLPRLALAGSGLALATVVAGWLLWPAPTPTAPSVPLAAKVPLTPPVVVESPRDQARRLYREGVAQTETARERGGHWLAARSLFEQSIAADPDWALPYMQLVFTFTNMVHAGFSANPDADLRAAERLLERLSSLEPNGWQTWNARAAVLRLQRRHADALAAYLRVVELSPNTLPARANAGLMLVLLGRAEEAIEPIRATIALAPPGHAFVDYWHACLGLALLHAGAEDFGTEAFRRAQTDTALVPGAMREIHLAAALALSGETAAAAALLADLRQRGADLSDEELRGRALSGEPSYIAQRENLFRGLAAARQHTASQQ
jgi:DNA-binding winged helix-turn-helix (wHTH) protein/tetratricopeptide (TPR) repeat protein